MSPAKRLAAGMMIAVSLTLAATPALAADQSIFAVAQVNLVKGALYYAQTMSGWFEGLTGFLQHRLQAAAGTVTTPKGLGSACTSQDQCKAGLACLNSCPNGGTDCETTVGKCAPRPSELLTIGQNGGCTLSDICTKGTVCTRACPPGIKCLDERLCLPPAAPTGTCTQDADCRATCAGETLPQIGDVAFTPACENQACLCHVTLVDASLTRVECPISVSTAALVCPYGTSPGCTLEGCVAGKCPSPRATCLKAPEFGGACLADAECAKADCPSGTSPFCSDGACKCQSAKIEAVSCQADSECAGIPCGPGQVKACVNHECACGVQVQADTNTCQAASDCHGDCPTDFNLACVDGQCACQRTTQAAPVKCTDVSQCDAVSCPQGFTKDCLNDTCSCTRAAAQP